MSALRCHQIVVMVQSMQRRSKKQLERCERVFSRVVLAVQDALLCA
jgi:hypothetical protein